MHVVVNERQSTRCNTEHRRRRLQQILDRESLKSPGPAMLRNATSLPSLALQEQQLRVGAVPCPSPVLVKCTPNLSPLRTHRQRSATRQLTLCTSRAREEPQVVENENTNQAAVEVIKDTHALINHQAALARQAEEWEARRMRSLAKQCKAAQLEQVQDKQQRRRDRKLDAQHVAEQIAWEHTQLDLVDQSRRLFKQTQLLELRESQLHSLELDRRQASAAKIARTFFDKLSVMDPYEAMAMFVAKQEELVVCCLEQMEECIEPHDLGQFKEMLRETLEKEELLLRHRLRAAQREEEVKATKKQAVVELKRSQYEEIQRHVQVTRQGKAEQRQLRDQVANQQEILDARYRALRDRKKQRDLELGATLQQQMRRQRAEQATVSLHVEGMSSPLLRTPFWSDESPEARLDTYERPPQSAISPGRPFIFAKKACQWYD